MKSLTRRRVKRNLAAGPVTKKTFFKRKTDFLWKSSVGKKTSENHDLLGPKNLLYNPGFDPELVKGLSDGELIIVIRTQNIEAYKELFARYHKKLFAYIYHLVGNREETEDILQNVFSKTYKSIQNFDTSRKFSSWIYRIAHNESVNFLKRKSKRYTISWDDISTSKDKLDSAFSEERPEEKMEHQEITKEVDWALEKLPKKYKQVLELRYFQEYSYEAMGKILHKPVNTVGTLINRAKRKLLEVVKGRDGV